MKQHVAVPRASHRSPNWHRRERAKRSAARKRVHVARAANLRARDRDLLLLSAHHSRPAYRELGHLNCRKSFVDKTSSGMGKQGWAAKDWGYGQQDGYSQSWRSHGHKNKHGMDKTPMEMAYHQVKVKEEGATAVGAAATGTDVGQERTLTQIVQRAVNQTRRTANKCKRAQEEHDACKKQWLEYERQMKEAYNRQREKYQQDLEWHEQEVIKAQDAALAAEESLKEVIKDSRVVGLIEEAVEDADGTDPWEELIAQKPAKETDRRDGHLAHYLHQAMQDSRPTVVMARTKAAEHRAAPAVPPATGSALGDAGISAAPSPAKYAAPAEGATTMDPYQFGLGSAENPAGGAAASAAAFPITPPRRINQPAKRTPVKEVGRALPKPGPRRGLAHETKLEALRAQLTKEAQGVNGETINLDPEDQDDENAIITTLKDAGYMD